MRRGRPWIPLLAGFLLVPALVTTLGFTVYGEELAVVFPSGSRTVEAIPPISIPSAPRVPIDWTALEKKPPAPAPPSAEAVQRGVTELFTAQAVKGITFAPGTSDLVGRGAEVQRAVANLLRPARGTVVTLVAHAWNGETVSHRCDVLAMHRASLVKDFLMAQGVPAGGIDTKVIVDPVWGAPSEGGPPVDIVVR